MNYENKLYSKYGKLDIPVLEAFLRFTFKRERQTFPTSKKLETASVYVLLRSWSVAFLTCSAINVIKLTVVYSCRALNIVNKRHFLTKNKR